MHTQLVCLHLEAVVVSCTDLMYSVGIAYYRRRITSVFFPFAVPDPNAPTTTTTTSTTTPTTTTTTQTTTKRMSLSTVCTLMILMIMMIL